MAYDIPYRHAFTSFHILGEGEVGAGDDELEPAAQPLAAASTAAATAASAPFRFTRMGPPGERLPRALRKKVAQAMTAASSDGTIPAGYTYLGQFIDHDLTMDKTAIDLGQNVSPAQLLQARSPSLDLDSLYGKGPADTPRFYESDGRKLKMGKTESVGSGVLGAQNGFDLPRTPGEKHATIPDPRNDENLAVAQTHLAFIRFHNRVIDEQSAPAGERFVRARRSVTKHYQWMVRHDYLPRICEAAVVKDVFDNGRRVFEANASPMSVPTMPVEFSVAAFRFGHSMVRGSYDWNREFPGNFGTLSFLFDFSGTSGFLGNGSRLPSNWIADWRRLYPFKQADLKVPASKFNRARRIDTLLVDPLGHLPSGSFGAAAAPSDPIIANLAFRNLARAKMIKLATGQDMVAKLRSKGVQVQALTKAQLRDGNGGADLSGLTATQLDRFVTKTPLWFYVLREAELNNGKMTGVGARIIAETFHRAIEGSESSIVRDTAFRPHFGPNSTTFDMRDLLHFAFEGKKKLLAPLGD